MKRSLLHPLFFLMIGLLPGAAAESAPVALAEARAALQANDLPKAAALLEPLTGAAGTDAAAFSLLSEVKLAQKDAKGAVDLAEKATKLDATKAAYFSQLGMALSQRIGEVSFVEQAMMSGKLRKAFAKAVELDPNDVSGLIGLARFYGNAPEIAGGSPEKAKDYAMRVQRLDPFLGAIELANVAERGEDYATALGQYEEAARLKPGSPGLQAACGRMLAKLGRKDEARARFEAALKLNPKHEAAKQGLAALDGPKP